MKRVLPVLFYLLLTIPLMAQQWVENLPQDKAQNGTLSFYDVQKAFNDYWEPFNVEKGKYIDTNGKLVKAPGWKQFKRWEYYWESRVNQTTGEFPNTSAIEEYKKWLDKNPQNNPKSASGNWVSLGPSSSAGGYAGTGRLNCIAFHPTDNNTYWVGSPSGGLWKTTDNGSSWTVLTDNNEVLGVSDIALSAN